MHRKLGHLVRKLKTKEHVEKDKIMVQLSTCITKESYHGPVCQHLDYLKELINSLGLDLKENTTINPGAERKRQAGSYRS